MWSWFTKKQPEEDILEETWKEFDKSYSKMLSKVKDDDATAIKKADFRAPFNQFCIP